jgi:hypothetical protein
MASKDGMQLYQHSTHCPVAMQMFLNYNPRYWRFVPMAIADAQHDDATYPKSTRPDEDALLSLENLPPAPRGYQFSARQRDQQVEFFKKKYDRQLPGERLDLYNASVIAVGM